MKRHGNGKRMFKRKAAAGAFGGSRGQSIRPGGPPQAVVPLAFHFTGLAGFRPLVVPDVRALPTKDG